MEFRFEFERLQLNDDPSISEALRLTIQSQRFRGFAQSEYQHH